MPTRERLTELRGHPIYLMFGCITAAFVLLMSQTYGTLLITNPSFHIHNFYVPALNKLTNSTTTSDNVIFFDLTIQNYMTTIGVRYVAMNLTFSYSSIALGTYTVPDFYQGMDKKAQRREVVAVTTTLPWNEDLSGGSTADFRVDLATGMKFKNWFWFFKDKKMTAGGRVGVDDSGKKVGTASVELKSGERPASVLTVFLWYGGFVILTAVCVAAAVVATLCLVPIIYIISELCSE